MKKIVRTKELASVTNSEKVPSFGRSHKPLQLSRCCSLARQINCSRNDQFVNTFGRRSTTSCTAFVSGILPSTINHATTRAAERFRPSTQCTSTVPSGTVFKNCRKGERCSLMSGYPSSSFASSASTCGSSLARLYSFQQASTAAFPIQFLHNTGRASHCVDAGKALWILCGVRRRSYVQREPPLLLPDPLHPEAPRPSKRAVANWSPQTRHHIIAACE